MKPVVAIAVVSWNTRDLLDACLESMRSEAESGRCEVWVIDNGSSDGSADMVRDKHGWAQLVVSKENLGFGRAVNKIAERTTSEWIAASNADVALRPGAMDALLEGGMKAGTGSVAPQLETLDRSTQHSVHPFPTPRLAFLHGFGLHHLPGVGRRWAIEGYWDPVEPRTIDWAHGAFLLIRREAFIQIGGFDPGQWMYAEDIDIHWRLAENGWQSRYVPSARVFHAVSAATTKAFGDSKAERHIAATYQWQMRRQGTAAARVSALVNTLGAAVRWLAVLPLSAISPRRWGPSRTRLAAYAKAHAIGLRRRTDLIRSTLPPGRDDGS